MCFIFRKKKIDVFYFFAKKIDVFYFFSFFISSFGNTGKKSQIFRIRYLFFFEKSKISRFPSFFFPPLPPHVGPIKKTFPFKVINFLDPIKKKVSTRKSLDTEKKSLESEKVSTPKKKNSSRKKSRHQKKKKSRVGKSLDTKKKNLESEKSRYRKKVLGRYFFIGLLFFITIKGNKSFIGLT